MSHILAQKQLRSIILSVSRGNFCLVLTGLNWFCLRLPASPPLRRSSVRPSVRPAPEHLSASPSRQNVIRSPTPINDEMAHQLYVLQVLTFNLLEDRMMTKMDPQDQVMGWIFFHFRLVGRV